jgi:hypothetical protein
MLNQPPALIYEAYSTDLPQSERLGVYLSLLERAPRLHEEQSVVIERGATAVEVATAVTYV